MNRERVPKIVQSRLVSCAIVALNTGMLPQPLKDALQRIVVNASSGP